MLIQGPDDLAHALATGETRLVSPAGWGPAWWMALTGNLSPGVTAVYDAGQAPGMALAALRTGCRFVQLDAPAPVFAKVHAIGLACGATVLPPAAELLKDIPSP